MSCCTTLRSVPGRLNYRAADAPSPAPTYLLRAHEAHLAAHLPELACRNYC